LFALCLFSSFHVLRLTWLLPINKDEATQMGMFGQGLVTFLVTLSQQRSHLLALVERIDSQKNSPTRPNPPLTATLANWGSIENKGSHRPCRSFLINKFSSTRNFAPTHLLMG
jgi:hypothetical protein